MTTGVTTNMSDVSNLVNDRFSQAKAVASEQLADLSTYMDSIISTLQGITPPDISGLETLPVITEVNIETIPHFDLAEFNIETTETRPTREDLPDFDDIDVANLPDAPTFTAEKVSAPNLSIPSFNTSAPSLKTIAFPSKPTTDLPDVPVLPEIVLPSAPVLTTHSLDSTMPVLDTLQDPVAFSYNEDIYSSDVWADLITKVLTDIRNGGTGLSAEVEDAIYERARDRQREENNRLYTEAQGVALSSGFSLPPSSYAALMVSVQAEISRKNDATSREITINQAELAQKNTQFMMEKGIELERLLRDFYTQQHSRRLQASTAASSASIAIYQAMLGKFGVLVEAYKVDVSAFAEKIQAELTKTEIYKSKIEAAKTQASIQAVQVDLYTKRVQALQIIVEMFSAETNAAKVQVEAELSKIESYKAQVDAYGVRVEAEKTKVGIYGIEVEAEKNRVGAYAESVRAYESKVRAASINVEAQVQASNQQIQEATLQIEAYKADLQAYGIDLDSAVKRSGLLVDGYKANAAAHEANSNAVASKTRSQIAYYEAQLKYGEAGIRTAIAQLETVNKLYLDLKELQVQGILGMAGTAAQVAASALNAVNASASLSHGSSSSDSTSDSTTHVDND